MIVTCASCLTKYHLDDSRVSEKGAKVRCSRCKHVFYVVRPPETVEQVAEGFESFSRYHQELMGAGPREVEQSPQADRDEATSGREVVVEEEREEEELFSDKKIPTTAEPWDQPLQEEVREPTQEATPMKVGPDLWRVRRSRPRPTRLLALLVVITLLLLGLFYVWTEIDTGGRISSYLGDPIGKTTRWWERFWGTEKEGLILKDLTGYEEKVGDIPLYIIEGKVANQSSKMKRLIRVRVTIFDQNKIKVAEKETLCGPVLGRGELKHLPPSFFAGDMILQPKTEKDLMASPGSRLPFMVVFKDLPAQAKEFKVEIVEAPSL